MTGHTPGPWWYDRWDLDGEGLEKYEIGAKSSRKDSPYIYGVTEDPSEGEVVLSDADAHLIAAAPDLLETIERIRHLSFDAREGIMDADDALKEIFRLTGDTITKTEGRDEE